MTFIVPKSEPVSPCWSRKTQRRQKRHHSEGKPALFLRGCRVWRLGMEGRFMAGDWIKMRACLASDPKVIAIGKHLEQHSQFGYWITCGQYQDAVTCDVALRYVVTGALHNVWCNANEHCNGDVVLNADLLWVDAVAGIQNFGSAMQSVGWVEVVDGGLRFPKFNSHNTSAAERQKRYREKKALQRCATRDVTQDVTATSKRREEKRREEKNMEEDNTDTGARKRAVFVRPTAEEVRTYCQERSNHVDPEAFVAYYEANGWRVGRNPMKDWKAAIVTWERNGYGKPTQPVKEDPYARAARMAREADEAEQRGTV